jgi:pimeloyl-ACP methyl ester carboxylesterase
MEFLGRRWRTALLSLTGLLLVASAAIMVAGWYFADVLKDGALIPPEPDKLDLRVESVDGGSIVLTTTKDTESDGDWSKRGTFGLEWEGGYGQVGDVLQTDEGRVVREFTPILGTPRANESARIDSFAFPGDPQQALSMPFADVRIPSALGEFPAWSIEGTRDTWAIFVHGRGSSRREALRILPVFNSLGIPSLVITYRNDDGAPSTADGLYRYGETEWTDLEAAASYAMDHGARALILVGYSMGGGIVMKFLYDSSLADRVAGVMLDAPMLDFERTIDWAARDRFVPWPVKAMAKRIAAARFDIHWGELDYLRNTGRLDAPILLFHGDDDDTTPIATSEALARARPDIVRFIPVHGAGHVRSWNADPASYEDAVRTFLSSKLDRVSYESPSYTISYHEHRCYQHNRPSTVARR